MRFFKQPLMLLALGGLMAGASVPAYAQDAEAPQASSPESARPTFVVTYQCQSGKFARIVTHDANFNDALQKLSKGETTPAQVLNYVAQNAEQELDRTIVFLDVCVGVKFRRT